MVSSTTRTAVSCVVIANPAAGTVSPAVIDDLTRVGAEHDAAIDIRWTSAPGEATRLAESAAAEQGEEFRVIVSVGGDGTTREVVEGLTRVPVTRQPVRHALFIVPAGTGNSGYRSHWGEQAWQASLAVALADPAAALRMLDLARHVEQDRVIVLGAGAGLTADVLNLAPSTMRGRAKLQAGLELAAQRFTPFPGRVTVDGRVVHEGTTVFANLGGGRHRAWQYLVLPHSVLDDGLLDVCVVGGGVAPVDLPDLIRSGQHVTVPGAVYDRGRRVVLERTDGQPLCFEHDGDLVAHPGSRVTVDVLANVLPTLCLPRG